MQEYHTEKTDKVQVYTLNIEIPKHSPLPSIKNTSILLVEELSLRNLTSSRVNAKETDIWKDPKGKYPRRSPYTEANSEQTSLSLRAFSCCSTKHLTNASNLRQN